MVGYFEAMLHQRYPKHQLAVRNLSWPADTPSLQPRPSNFADTDFSNSLFSHADLSHANFSGAYNYRIDLQNTKLKGATFSRLEALSLLDGLEIKLVD